MRAPPCVRDIADKPGIYKFNGIASFWFFEVAEKGRIYQLKPDTFERDGLLVANEWTLSSYQGSVERIENHD